MKTTLRWLSTTVLLSAALVCAGELDAGFRQPPDSAKPQTWWHWVNGNITREGITADLEAMRRVGLGGAQIFNPDCEIPAGPVKFMSAQWRELVTHAVKEADRLGLELCIHNCAGWSSSGGPWNTPEHAMQFVTFSEQQVRGPRQFSGVLPPPPARNKFYREIAVLAFATPEGNLRLENLKAKAAFERGDNLQPAFGAATPPAQAIQRAGLVDLTAQMAADGNLKWDVPDGAWTILRLGYTLTGATNGPAPATGRGLECDKLSRAAVAAHWDGMMQKVIADAGPLAGKTLNNVLIDSYEVGSQNWTPLLRQEFQQRRGYDPLPFLPVFSGRVVESVELSERFLWDLRRTLADLWAENYAGAFAELAHQNGMQFSVEPYGNGPFEDFSYGGHADIPMGEFWAGSGASGSCKLAASIGHIYGRKFIGAESFTASPEYGKWTNDPYSMKALGDLIYTSGVNRFIFHRYAHQPWLDKFPGMTMGPYGIHFERTTTWWEQGAAWLAYLARCQFMLQQGRFVADACYFCGEGAPVSLRAGNPALPVGYDYDGCNAEALARMSVKDGRVVLPSGMSYRVLILPPERTLTPPVLRKISQLVADGATVVGPKPAASPSLQDYPQCDRDVKVLADELWGNCDGKKVTEHPFGKGRMAWGKPLADVFAGLELKPDFEIAGPKTGARLVYIHRVAGDAEIYFVSNQKPKDEEVECTFRMSGKVPEFWHPDTGAIEQAPVFSEKDGRITLPLRFDPAGSVFVVFREPAAGDHVTGVKWQGTPRETAVTRKLEIRRAVYGIVADARVVDVTAKLAGHVKDGALSVEADNGLAGDPAPNVVKQLRVEYVLDGKPLVKLVREGEPLDLPEEALVSAGPAWELCRDAAGKLELRAAEPGTCELTFASGRTARLEAQVGAPLGISGPWEVRFPPKWGAPEQIILDKLISWTDHGEAGVRYFSGTATYIKEIEFPAEMFGPEKALYLDLGRVKNLAQVYLNGTDFGVLWKPPFRVDITGAAHPGVNRLEVRITNLWPNRLIGDEQLPDDCQWVGQRLKQWPAWLMKNEPRPASQRLTFTTWKHYTRSSPLLESGLLGPVRIRVVAKSFVAP